MSKNKNNRTALEVGGVIAIITLLVALVQLWQSKTASDSQDSAQSTQIALLQKQLDVENKIATLQSSSSGVGPTSTVIAKRIIELESTRAALATQEASIKQTNSEQTGEILFQDDFEDGNIDGWTINGGQWKVVQDQTGNHALEGQDIDFAHIEAGSSNWENYVFEVTLKVVDNSKSQSGEIVNLFFRETPSCNRYDLIINTTWVNLERQSGSGCNSQSLKGTSINLPFNEWVTFRVEVMSNIIRCIMDGKDVFLIKDSQPLPNGAIALAVQENGRVLFDNVKVTKLIQP